MKMRRGTDGSDTLTLTCGPKLNRPLTVVSHLLTKFGSVKEVSVNCQE